MDLDFYWQEIYRKLYLKLKEEVWDSLLQVMIFFRNFVWTAFAEHR